jgi:hypothetical protein
LARQYFGLPPLRDVQLLPDDADPPEVAYLKWHKERIFAA